MSEIFPKEMPISFLPAAEFFLPPIRKSFPATEIFLPAAD